MEVHPTVENAAEQSHSEETWPFSSLSASRPRPFEEHAKPAISFEVQEKSDFSYMNGGTDREGGTLCSMTLVDPELAENERKSHEIDNVITVLVDRGASGNYLDDISILDLNHRFQDFTSPSTPRAILTAGGALLDGTAKGALRGLITDDYGEQHLARIANLRVPGIGRNVFSLKTSATKGVVSIFDVNKPRLEAGDITVAFRGENDELYSLKLDLSVDGYAGKELAMNAVANAYVWHRRLDCLNKRTLALVNQTNDNGMAFDGSIADCDVCAVGKSRHLTRPKKANHAAINAPFQLVYGDLMGPFKPTAHSGCKFVSKITDQFTKWTAIYLFCSKDQALASLQLFFSSTVIPLGQSIIRWHADKGSKFTVDKFKDYCLGSGIT